MSEIKTQLHSLDLRQIEAITQLQAQLNAELQNIATYQNAIAVALQGRQHIKLEIPGSKKITEEQVEKEITQLEKAFEKHVTAAKAALFNTSNTINQLHKNRVNLLAPTPAPVRKPVPAEPDFDDPEDPLYIPDEDDEE
jgi:hypothetical protein